jgi:hypothetical protein
MRRLAIIGMLLPLLLPVLALGQDRVAVFEFEGVGIDRGSIEAATHIFRNELNATGKFSVIPRADMEAMLAEKGIVDLACSGVTCAAEYGLIVGADKAVIGSLTRLGEKVTAEVSLVSVVRKEVEFGDRFSAASLDDLDNALKKLAQAVAERKKIESEVTRFAISEAETREAPRKRSFITAGAAFGPGFPLGDSYLKVNVLYNILAVVRYEADRYVVETSFGTVTGSGGEKDTLDNGDPYDGGKVITDKKKVVILPWDIGLRYIFNRESDFTPFVGGGIGLHAIVSQDVEGVTYTTGAAAFAFHVAGGLYMFQSYDFRLALEARYTGLYTDAFSDSYKMSHQIGFLVSVATKIERKKEREGCSRAGCLW